MDEEGEALRKQARIMKPVGWDDATLTGFDKERRGRVSDEELLKMVQELPGGKSTVHALESTVFYTLKQVRDQTEQRKDAQIAALLDLHNREKSALEKETEQRVRRETLEWILDHTNSTDSNIWDVISKELKGKDEVPVREEIKCTP